MPKLEVIVTSAAEAFVAAAGGADRLELVRDLDSGGLTPSFETARAVIQSVAIPVRVMLRENASMLVESAEEFARLRDTAAQLGRLPLDGLVLGWTIAGGELDTAALEAVLAAAPQCKVTFHRAFEHLRDPFAVLRVLKEYKQIDRILTNGGAGSWPERKARLRAWRQAAAPEIGILVGGGLSDAHVAELMRDAEFPEVHIGRAARTPPENHGQLDAARIASLKQ